MPAFAKMLLPLATALVLFSACSPEEATSGEVDSGLPQDAASGDTRRCRPGPGATGSPRSIDEALTLANSLPLPVTAECFVESLDRPLRLEASRSIFSAQPAVGARSPRLFLFFEPLIITIVPDGVGRELIEFGELVSETRSLKGEIPFPLTERLGPEAPYEQVLFRDDLTVCAFCHADEVPSSLAEGGFESVALRPGESTIIPIDFLLEQQRTCDREAEPERCAYLDAIVKPGPLEHHPFPEELPIFGE